MFINLWILLPLYNGVYVILLRD